FGAGTGASSSSSEYSCALWWLSTSMVLAHWRNSCQQSYARCGSELNCPSLAVSTSTLWLSVSRTSRPARLAILMKFLYYGGVWFLCGVVFTRLLVGKPLGSRRVHTHRDGFFLESLGRTILVL